MWPVTDLAQAKSPRSGERSALAQATDSRLGEIATKALGGFANARLGKTISLERDGLSLKTQFTRLSEYSSKNPGRGSASLA